MTESASSPMQYHVTFAVVPQGFPQKATVSTDLSRLSPRQPKGEGWRLASTACVAQADGPVMLYYWERRAPAHSP